MKIMKNTFENLVILYLSFYLNYYKQNNFKLVFHRLAVVVTQQDLYTFPLHVQEINIHQLCRTYIPVDSLNGHRGDVTQFGYPAQRGILQLSWRFELR